MQLALFGGSRLSKRLEAETKDTMQQYLMSQIRQNPFLDKARLLPVLAWTQSLLGAASACTHSTNSYALLHPNFDRPQR
jgi:hypothetical protein